MECPLHLGGGGGGEQEYGGKGGDFTGHKSPVSHDAAWEATVQTDFASALCRDVRFRAGGRNELRQKLDRHVDRQHIGDNDRSPAVGVYRIEIRALVGQELHDLANLRLSGKLH